MVSKLVWQAVYEVIVGVIFTMTLEREELTPSMMAIIHSTIGKVELLIQDHQEEDERVQKLEEAN